MRRARDVTAAPLLLVAHGTRDPAGPQEIERIANAVAGCLDVSVHVAYVDVIGPTVADVLRVIDGPAVVLPAFLASGYHVRTDLPEQIETSGCGSGVVLSAPLGPAPEVAEAMLDRLTAVGWKPGDQVLFSAAGSSDPRALSDVRSAAQLLGRRCDQWLSPSYVTTARPLTSELCAEPRAAFIAPYLLAPGLFHRKLAELPVSAVADPIGAHPQVVDLIVRRYRAACRDGRSAA
jgi:sirohydrochlorin ferrochelatase